MRFVPLNCLREGMTTASQLFGKNGELLLNRGAQVKPSYIEKIREIGYNGIYIDDDLSRDIEIIELIDENLKHKTVQTVKTSFIGLEQGRNLSGENLKDLTAFMSNILDELLSTRDIMINMIDMKVFDDYTFYHSVNVMILSLVIGITLGLNREQLLKLGMSSLLHDIGKVFIPREILNKPGRLDNWEYEIIKGHSSKGYEYLKNKSLIPASSYIGILHHHETFNGNGYPNKLSEDKISLFGRIISVADVYDALTSNRPYRKAMIPSEAVEYLMGGGGTHFDPEIVNNFIKKIAPYPVGTCITLSDGRTAIVVQNFNDCCIRPKIRVLKQDNKDVVPYYVNLRDDEISRNVTITGVADVI